jgi:hypothetical protein
MKSLFSKGGFEMQNPFLKVCIGFAVLFSVMFTVSCATTGPPFFAEKAYFPGFCPACQ